ncbi:hypothetical protein WJX84_002334 [Apatococcus fuscideae]|uniref:Matrin-type domain-containing protein n=1 Tax=Apatococcus fuscideae TaxID=2026836 RepID=A0AAW1SLF8_9CHLO
MTEFWKSNPMFWCDYCKVWMQDNPHAKAVHERGIKHQERVEKKLRDMRRKAVSDKKEEELAVSTMSSIKAKARKEYEEDMRKAGEAQRDHIGTWRRKQDEDVKKDADLWHNSAVDYYFDDVTKMYYGGDPAAWTTQPEIPNEARFENAPHAGNAPAKGPGSSAGQASKPAPVQKKLVPKHPLAELGGRSMPEFGHIGGAKGIGSSDKQFDHQLQTALTAKRKREEQTASKLPASKGRPLSKADAEALAKREAAKARVQQRELREWGML